MRKRGQMTIFIILGIIIIVAVVLVIAFRSETVKQALETGVSETLSFSESVELVEKNIQDCLDKSLHISFKALSVSEVKDYKEAMAESVKREFSKCINFAGIPVDVYPGQIKAVEVDYGAGDTKVIVRMDYEVLVKRGTSVERLKDFYSEKSIFPNCCIPVDVNSDCEAKDDINIMSCGIVYDLQEGDKVVDGGGECIAC